MLPMEIDHAMTLKWRNIVSKYYYSGNPFEDKLHKSVACSDPLLQLKLAKDCTRFNGISTKKVLFN
jgi:hypothetical protein